MYMDSQGDPDGILRFLHFVLKQRQENNTLEDPQAHIIENEW